MLNEVKIMKIEIETTPKFRKIKIKIDDKDYTDILPLQVKQHFCNTIQMKLLEVEDTPQNLQDKYPPSKTIDPKNYTELCDICPLYLTNCAKYFKHLHGKIEICEYLYKMVLEHHILPPEADEYDRK